VLPFPTRSAHKILWQAIVGVPGTSRFRRSRKCGTESVDSRRVKGSQGLAVRSDGATIASTI
jgi:hypothetical protein